jgi:hypothetical protein
MMCNPDVFPASILAINFEHLSPGSDESILTADR